MCSRVFCDVRKLTSVFLWSLCFLVSFGTGNVTGMKSWSVWYDSTALDGVKNETIDNIREIFDYDCDHIDDVQCRVKSSIANVNSTTLQDGNHLVAACNSSENLCALLGQIFFNLEATCNEYEIRFLCYVAADSPQVESSSDSLSINGGFIAMAAGLSVVVPLICVLVMQLRRAKREERERARQRTDASGGENGATDPPPSYEQVFGSSYEAVSHSRNGSMDVLIDENETTRSSQGIGGRDNEAYVAVRGSTGALEGVVSNSSQVTAQVSRLNPTYSGTSVATISGSQVADIPVSLMVSQSGLPGIHVLSSTDRGSNSNNSNPSTSQIMSGSSNSQVSTRPSSSSSAQTTSPQTALPPPPPPPTPPPPRSPPPPFSSWSFRNLNRNGPTNTGTSRIQEALRRFPGMHISIEDFFASLRGLQDNENEGPPPSYEEALKILESAALSEDRNNIIK